MQDHLMAGVPGNGEMISECSGHQMNSLWQGWDFAIFRNISLLQKLILGNLLIF